MDYEINILQLETDNEMVLIVLALFVLKSY